MLVVFSHGAFGSSGGGGGFGGVFFSGVGRRNVPGVVEKEKNFEVHDNAPFSTDGSNHTSFSLYHYSMYREGPLFITRRGRLRVLVKDYSVYFMICMSTSTVVIIWVNAGRREKRGFALGLV